MANHISPKINLHSFQEGESDRIQTVVWRAANKAKHVFAGIYKVTVPDNIVDPAYWAQAHTLWFIFFKGALSVRPFQGATLSPRVSSNCELLVQHLNYSVEEDSNREVLRRDGGFTRAIRFTHPDTQAVMEEKTVWKDEILDEYVAREIEAPYDINAQLEPILLNIKGIGRCSITPHAMARFMQYYKFNKTGENRFAPMSTIRQVMLVALWREVTFPKRVLASKSKKYAKKAKYYLKSGEELFLTVTKVEDDLNAIKTLFWMNPELAMQKDS